jgi:energy-coupling factor transport system substrate-specific component
MENSFKMTKQLALIAVGIAVNLGIGFVVAALKMPFYLDSVGTVVVAALGGFIPGVICAVVSVLIGSIYTPTLWAYAPTGIVIALYVSAVRKLGYLDKVFATVAGGIGLGIISAMVSAPITAFVWKGVSLSGADALTAFFSATGESLLESVVLGGLATDPIDKLFTSVIVYLLLKRVPKSWQMVKNAKAK